MMWHGSWSGTNWVLMSLLMLVFWTAVVAVVLWLAATLRRPHPGNSTDAQAAGGQGPATPDARANLDDRLAHGDLTAEEYQARRDLLSNR